MYLNSYFIWYLTRVLSMSTLPLLFSPQSFKHNNAHSVLAKQGKTRNNRRCVCPLQYVWQAGRNEAQMMTQTRSADHLQTTPVLCAVTLELTGNIFFLLSWAKWETERGNRTKEKMSASLTWAIICYKLMPRDDCLGSRAQRPQTRRTFKEWCTKHKMRTVCLILTFTAAPIFLLCILSKDISSVALSLSHRATSVTICVYSSPDPMTSSPDP